MKRRFEPRRRALPPTLSYLRVRAGLSLRGAESASGISRGLLSEFERGRRLPTLRELEALSAAYGVKPNAWRFITLAVLEDA